MLDNLPIVSVLTAIYNNEDYIISALNSVNNQTYPKEKIEHFIINDQSPGCIKNILTWLKRNNYNHQYILNETNLGFPKTINKFLLLCKGKYFSIISDDIWHCERIEKLVSTFERLNYKNNALIFSDMELINSKGKTIHDSYIIKRNGNKNELLNTTFNHTLAYIKEESCVSAPSCLWNTKAIKNIGMYNTKMAVEDYDMHMRLSLSYNFKYLDEKLVKYRIHQGSLSRNINVINSYYRVWTYSNIFSEIPSEYVEILTEKIIEHSKRALVHGGSYSKEHIDLFLCLFKTVGIFSTIKILSNWLYRTIRLS